MPVRNASASKEKTGPGVGHILVHFEARDINPSVL